MDFDVFNKRVQNDPARQMSMFYQRESMSNNNTIVKITRNAISFQQNVITFGLRAISGPNTFLLCVSACMRVCNTQSLDSLFAIQ